MTSPHSERERLQRIADELVERHRRGERFSLTEYITKYPGLVDYVRGLLGEPTLTDEAAGAEGPPPAPPPAASAPATPAQLGEYRILREVGRGGMGIVYEAVQESLGRHVALKVLPWQGQLDPVYLARFRREAQMASRLHHSNIVPIFGVGEHQGIYYYAMQLIHGQGLDRVLQYVKRLRSWEREPSGRHDTVTFDMAASVALGLMTGRFSLSEQAVALSVSASALTEGGPAAAAAALPAGPEAGLTAAATPDSASELGDLSEAPYYHSVARIGLQVAEALAYAHQHGICHRDIKPANLLLDTEGAVWVTDFGLAKSEGSEDLTRSNAIVGTLRYMAPERFQGVTDPRGDIYALALTLYEMVALEPGFPETDRARLMQRIMHENPVRPRRLAPLVPRDLETIILKGLAKNPAHRYATAEDMAEDLRRFLDNRPIRARRVSLLERGWRWCQRNPALAAISSTALVTVFGLTLGLALQQAHAAARLRDEHQQTVAALRHNESLAARLTVDNSLALCERGDVAPGLLGLAHSLQLATQTDDADLEEVIRSNLSAWWAQLHPLRMVLPHSGVVMTVAHGPDGQVLVGGEDGTLRRWHAGSGEPDGPPLRFRGQIRALAISPDGKKVLVGAGDLAVGEAWLLELATGRKLLGPLPHRGEIRGVAFRSDGKVVATCSIDYTAQLWDTTTGKPLLRQPLRHRDQVQAIAFSPDGTKVLTGSMDRTARIWDARTGELLRELKGHRGEVWAAAFSRDGTRVLTSSLDRTARLWDARTGEPAWDSPIEQQGGITTALFSPDGKLVLTGSGSDCSVRLWRADTGKPVGLPLEHRSGVQAAAFSPDGRCIVVGTRSGTVWIWELLRPQRAEVTVKHPSVVSLAFHPDGASFASGGMDGKVHLRSIQTGAALQPDPLQPGGEVTIVAFSPDGKLLLSGHTDGKVHLWRTDDGRLLGPVLEHPGSIGAAAFGSDGCLLAVGNSSDESVLLWDTASARRRPGKPLPFLGLVSALDLSCDRRLLCTGTRDQGARLWQVGTGEPAGPILPHQGGCWSGAFSPDGATLATGSGNGTVQLWDVGTQQPIRTALQHHRKAVTALAWRRDGRRVLTGSADGTARLWDVATARAIGPPLPLSGWLLAVAFSPDGEQLRASDGRVVVTQPAPAPVPGDVERITLWLQVMTGAERDAHGIIQPLDPATWRQRRQRLAELGGLPQS